MAAAVGIGAIVLTVFLGRRRPRTDAARRAPSTDTSVETRAHARFVDRPQVVAALALFAIVAGGVGVAAVLIFGDRPKPSTAPRHRARRLAPPPPKVPTPVEFTVGVVVTEQSCAPRARCTYKYTIEPKYIGLHPLPETPFTVFYEVLGGNAPQKGEFTVRRTRRRS